MWKDIKGYEDLYATNENGNIKSYSKKDTKGVLRKERILKPSRDSNGYTRVYLIKDGTGKRFKMHRLVAITFLPNPKNKSEVNHINGIKDDNRLKNLEWSTPSENTKHAHSTGLVKKLYGEDKHTSKLTKEQVIRIKTRLEHEETLRSIAHSFNVALTTISSIKTGKTWKNI